MNVNHKVFMDLTSQETASTVDVVQDDLFSRSISFVLRCGTAPWHPPGDSIVFIKYRKPDGTGGEYDTMPDGAPAYEIRENMVTVSLVPEVLSAAGSVQMVITLVSGASRLTTFGIRLNVSGTLVPSEETEEYVNITGYLPQPVTAVTGQFLEISQVDEHGKITELKAVDPLKAAGLSIPEHLVTCDLSESAGDILPDESACQKPQMPLQTDDARFFPLTTEDQVLMSSGQRLSEVLARNLVPDYSAADRGRILWCTDAGPQWTDPERVIAGAEGVQF